VKSAGTTSVLPVSFNDNTTWIRIVGHPYNGEHNEVNQREVSPDSEGETSAWALLHRNGRSHQAAGRHHQ
jgi:hypothetical protein